MVVISVINGCYYLYLCVPEPGDYACNLSSDVVLTLDPNRRYTVVLENDVLRLVAGDVGSKPSCHHKNISNVPDNLRITRKDVIKPLVEKYGAKARFFGEIFNTETNEIVFPLANVRKDVKRKW